MAQPTNIQEFYEALKGMHEAKDEVKTGEYRYVIYARKSTNESEGKQVRSLGDQVLECKEYAERNNLKVVDIIQEAESAKEPETRLKFSAILSKLKKGEYNGILAWHPDRLSRNMKEAGEVIDLLDKHIIKDLKFVSFSFENTASGKMLLGITFVLSKEYSDKLSDNVTRGNERSIEEGKYINKPKHGYYKDPNQYLRPDGNNFLLIKTAFKLRVQGKTLQEIGEYLNENGYQKSRKDGVRKPFIMTKSKVEKFMRDPAYTGVVKYGKKVVNLTEWYDFQPAVSVGDFLTINKLTNDSQLIKLAGPQRRGDNIKANLMRGMIICNECGENMHAGITPKKTKDGFTKYYYIRCDTDDCSQYGKSIRARVVIDYIKEFLDTKPFSTPEAYKHYTEEMRRVSDERLLEAKSALQSLQSQKRVLESNLLKTKDLLRDEQDEEIKDQYKPDLKKINASITNIGVLIDEKKDLVSKGKTSILTYSEFLELMESTRQTIGKIKNIDELDYIIKKIYLNFSIQGKKVIKSTLSEPFMSLYNQKISKGGRERT